MMVNLRAAVVQALQINHAITLFRVPHARLGLLVLASEILPLPGESRLLVIL